MQLDIGWAQIDALAAELLDAGRKTHSSTERRLLENHRQCLAFASVSKGPRVGFDSVSNIQHGTNAGSGMVGKGEKVATHVNSEWGLGWTMSLIQASIFVRS